jgi:hypothetical protein
METVLYWQIRPDPLSGQYFAVIILLHFCKPETTTAIQSIILHLLIYDYEKAYRLLQI